MDAGIVAVMHIRSGRWLAVGGVLATVGGAASAVYWQYGKQASPRVSFWNLPGVVCLAVLVVGLIMMLVGFFARGEEGSGTWQSQRSGKNARNYQAARDLNINTGVRSSDSVGDPEDS
jgi:hypothetical protein